MKIAFQIIDDLALCLLAMLGQIAVQIGQRLIGQGDVGNAIDFLQDRVGISDPVVEIDVDRLVGGRMSRSRTQARSSFS